MRFVSRWALASVASLLMAGAVYLLGWLVGERMTTANQGWEMAFYWSPLVFFVIEAILGLGCVAGILGFTTGTGLHRRVQSVVAGLGCTCFFLAVLWR